MEFKVYSSFDMTTVHISHIWIIFIPSSIDIPVLYKWLIGNLENHIVIVITIISANLRILYISVI